LTSLATWVAFAPCGLHVAEPASRDGSRWQANVADTTAVHGLELDRSRLHRVVEGTSIMEELRV